MVHLLVFQNPTYLGTVGYKAFIPSRESNQSVLRLWCFWRSGHGLQLSCPGLWSWCAKGQTKRDSGLLELRVEGLECSEGFFHAVKPSIQDTRALSAPFCVLSAGRHWDTYWRDGLGITRVIWALGFEVLKLGFSGLRAQIVGILVRLKSNFALPTNLSSSRTAPKPRQTKLLIMRARLRREWEWPRVDGKPASRIGRERERERAGEREGRERAREKERKRQRERRRASESAGALHLISSLWLRVPYKGLGLSRSPWQVPLGDIRVFTDSNFDQPHTSILWTLQLNIQNLN